MSRNKNFSQIATNKFLSTQNADEMHGTHDEQKTQDVQNKQSTNKIQPKPRINMAFSSDLLSYLQIMARLDGCSITQYCNNLVRQDKINRTSDYNNAMKLFNQERS